LATIAARNFVDKKPESTLMQSDSRIYSLPRWRVTRWLADCGADVPQDIRVALIGNLYGTLPVFIGGILNTLLVAAVIAARSPTPCSSRGSRSRLRSACHGSLCWSLPVAER
jgi:hypothetical protein